MSKRKSYHEKLDKILDVFFKAETEESSIELEEKVLEDGTKISYDNLEAGTPVFMIPVEEGADPVPATDGEYKISDTEVLVVMDGKVSEVKAVEVEDETVEEEVVVEAEEEAVEEVANVADIFNLDKLQSLIDLTKEGFHTISLSVANGAIEWGTVYSESYQELSNQLDTKLSDKDKEIETMKAKFESDLQLLGATLQETAVVQAPVEGKTKPMTPKERKIAMLMEQRKEND